MPWLPLLSTCRVDRHVRTTAGDALWLARCRATRGRRRLVSDALGELRSAIRRLAGTHGFEPALAPFGRPRLMIEPGAVFHTGPSDVPLPLQAAGKRIVWAPEFMLFPRWAAGADLMFAEAAAWARPIRFARGAGVHAPALEVSRLARDAGVRRFVFARIGRPTIRAFDGTM